MRNIPSPLALVPDRLWDGTSESAVTGMAAVVKDGLIDSVIAAADLPTGLPRREFSGCTLIPGLIDSHVHYGAALGPAFLAAGVTTIRDVGNDLEWILAQRESHAADMAIGPGIVCCGHLHDGPRPIWPHMGLANPDVETLVASIRHHVARGVDQIKLYAGIDLELMRAAVAESHRLDRFVVAHLGNVKAEVAVTTGLDEFEHFDQCDVAWRAATQEEDDAMIDLLLQYNVVVNPTLVVWDRIGRMLDQVHFHDDRRIWVHPCHRDIWDRIRVRYPEPESRARFQLVIPHLKRFLRHAHARGVTVALGTDTPFVHLVPGFSMHDELAMYVDAGLRPLDALRSATSVNAGVLERESKIGRIVPGLQADFALVRGNPLERIDDISHIVATMRGGHLFDPVELLAAAQVEFEKEPLDAFSIDLQAYVNRK